MFKYYEVDHYGDKFIKEENLFSGHLRPNLNEKVVIDGYSYSVVRIVNDLDDGTVSFYMEKL